MVKSTNCPIDISSLSNDELHAELEKGYADLVSGHTKDAASVFAEVRG